MYDFTYDLWLSALTSGYDSNFEALTLVLTLVLPLVIKSDLISDIWPGLCFGTTKFEALYIMTLIALNTWLKNSILTRSFFSASLKIFAKKIHKAFWKKTAVFQFALHHQHLFSNKLFWKNKGSSLCFFVTRCPKKVA